jgi:hypothetical protein
VWVVYCGKDLDFSVQIKSISVLAAFVRGDQIPFGDILRSKEVYIATKVGTTVCLEQLVECKLIKNLDGTSKQVYRGQ